MTAILPSITLSRRQIGDADRVGGLRLLIRWPAALGPEPTDRARTTAAREATELEQAAAEAMVGEACQRAGLVPVHTRVLRCRRPAALGGETGVHLAVTLIGRRWVHASTHSRGRVAFAATPIEEP